MKRLSFWLIWCRKATRNRTANEPRYFVEFGFVSFLLALDLLADDLADDCDLLIGEDALTHIVYLSLPAGLAGLRVSTLVGQLACCPCNAAQIAMQSQARYTQGIKRK